MLYMYDGLRQEYRDVKHVKGAEVSEKNSKAYR